MMAERKNWSRSNIRRFPVTRDRHMRNKYGSRYVPCQVSGRYILFPEESAGPFSEGEYMALSIMTLNEGPERKLCDLIVTREDLFRAIDNVKRPER